MEEQGQTRREVPEEQCIAVQLSAEMTAMVDNEGEMQSKLGLMTARCRSSLAASVV